jgi:jouberin
MPFNENLCLINNTNSQGNSQKLEYKDTEVSFMLPLSTRPCDLRITGETKAEYNEAFIIKELVSDVFKTNTVMIFEVLDYGHKLILEGKEKLNREKLLPIAWGYLRVIGESSKHFGKHRVQLYQYKYQTNQAIVSKGIDLRTPEVFFDFNWPFHVF